MELQASTLIKERHKRCCGGWGLAELLWLGQSSPAGSGTAVEHPGARTHPASLAPDVAVEEDPEEERALKSGEGKMMLPAGVM